MTHFTLCLELIIGNTENSDEIQHMYKLITVLRRFI